MVIVRLLRGIHYAGQGIGCKNPATAR